jgi:ADP-ribose pyrophosphatase YjhB (NUDIX family)
MTAVFNDDGQILLSRRADLNQWTLPGGRLDAHESLEAAAVREVCEETGIEVAVESPMALYMLDGWRRLNVVFRARVVGGALRGRTDETRDNRFFTPAETFGISSGHASIIIRDAVSPRPPRCRTLTTPKREMAHLRWKFAQRYAWNLLRGKPEPRFPRFNVSATAVVWDQGFRRVLTLKHGGGRALPRVFCDGSAAPWLQLTEVVSSTTGVYAQLEWVGIWQDTPRSRLELVFATAYSAKPLFRGGEWTSARSAPLPQRDTDYLAYIHADYPTQPIWNVQAQVGTKAGDIIIR